MSIKQGDETRQFLYKYRPLAGDTPTEINKNTLAILEKGELYFSKPSDFNDPFDAKIDYDTNATDSEMRCYFNRLKNQFLDSIYSQFDIDVLITKIENGNVDKSIFAPGVSMSADNTKILCLSKDEKNILMWSHYAQNHAGICIGIRVSNYQNTLCIKVKDGYTRSVAGMKNLLPLHYVEYTADKPSPYNIFTGREDDLEPFFYQKCKLWEYEQEMRIILPDSLIIYNPIRIEQSEIGEIIFGLKAPQPLIDKVTNIVNTFTTNGNKVALYKCKDVKGKYGIDKIRLQ